MEFKPIMLNRRGEKKESSPEFKPLTSGKMLHICDVLISTAVWGILENFLCPETSHLTLLIPISPCIKQCG